MRLNVLPHMLNCLFTIIVSRLLFHIADYRIIVDLTFTDWVHHGCVPYFLEIKTIIYKRITHCMLIMMIYYSRKILQSLLISENKVKYHMKAKCGFIILKSSSHLACKWKFTNQRKNTPCSMDKMTEALMAIVSHWISLLYNVHLRFRIVFSKIFSSIRRSHPIVDLFINLSYQINIIVFI